MDAPETQPDDAVTAKLQASRKELLDLSLRNPLLHYRGSARRGVEITGEDAAQVFAVVVEQGRAMRFHATRPEPRPAAGGPARKKGRRQAQADAAADGEAAGSAGPDDKAFSLATPYPPSVLDARLLATYSDAWLGQQERGCNTLHLALGMLRWREAPDAQEDRFAPLLLVPVALERSSARSGWTLKATDEDPGVNISLAEKLQEFAIAAPASPDLDSVAGFAEYLDAWRRAIADRPHWSIEPGRVGLGFFSFARFLMWRDLDPAHWPGTHHPAGHPLLRALFQDGFRAGADDGSRGDLDARRPPGVAMELLDCDSSQANAIDRAAQGRNLVIHGPPGTGKSQTIANLIADAVAAGRRVLFVAEKLAALEVVKRRLDHCGVGDLCLEIHSDKANKKAVIENLRATLALGRPHPAAEEAVVAALADYRQRLNRYAVAVSLPVPPTGLTPFQAFGTQERLRAQLDGLPALPIAPMAALDADGYRRVGEEVGGLARIIADIGTPAAHPYHDCVVTQSRPGDEEAVAAEARSAGGVSADTAAITARLAAAMSVPAPATMAAARAVVDAATLAGAAPAIHGLPPPGPAWDDPGHREALRAGIAAGRAWAAGRAAWAATLLPSAWTTDVRGARADIALDGGSWWSRLFSSRYRAARRLLATVSQAPPMKDPQRLLAACDAILADQEAVKILAQHRATLSALFGTRWQDTASAWDDLDRIAAWCARWRAGTAQHPHAAALASWVVGPWDRAALADLATTARQRLESARSSWTALSNRLGHAHADQIDHTAFPTLTATAQRWAEGRQTLAAWTDYCRAAAHLRAQGFAALADHAHRGDLPAAALVPAFARAWAAFASAKAFDERPELAAFTAANHTELVERFQEADRAVFAANRARLADRHWRALPGETGFGQVGVLRRECAKKARHLPLRQLMHAAGAAVQAVKPVFMMSPLSVAAYLPQGAVEFDLVIFDEASQVRPVDALGAILRGRQMVVVGDEQQMPPTSFFDKMVTDEADPDDEESASETADMQSVLGLCLGRGMHQEMLRWHYRSRHDSLIALSNREFYRGDLVVFPSARRGAAGEGLRLDLLPDTIYERGATRTNPLEADAVIAAVVEHLRLRPGQSLGVVAFSSAQANAIADRIERLRHDDPASDALLKDLRPDEPFLVKNLENVQGDERDAIFISVGYGRDAQRNLTMNFGPLGQQGGERRLNVLITRARICCRVFTNVSHDDIDLRRAHGRGIQVFKQFLHFAATGKMEQSVPTGADHDSAFEQEVCAELRRRGFDVEAQVGCSGYRIDLAVIDPKARGSYLLGIECDGAMYHSSRWARDRDRLREAILRSLGWRIHRIWSTDWFRRRDDCVKRLLGAIAAATTAAAAPTANHVPSTAVTRDALQPPAPDSRFIAYRLATVKADLGGHHLADVDSATLGRKLADVVAVESPMHIEDLRRRVLDAIEGRAGTRRLAAIDAGVDAAAELKLLRRAGDVLWSPGDRELRPRDRSALPESARAAHLVDDAEYAAAVLAVVAEGCGCADADEAGTQAVIALGIKRNDEAGELAARAVNALIADGRLLVMDDGRIHLRKTGSAQR